MRSEIGPRKRRSLSFILTLFIVLIIGSSYSNTFTSPPYLDDFHSFINVNALYLHSLSFSTLLALSRTQFGWARFLPDVTFALNHYFGHSNLIYFHAVNILIHIFAFFAVLWLVSMVLAAEKKMRPGVEIPYDLEGFFPLCVAAVWALSPVQTNAVTYLVQRMASMQALFFALSAACFIKARLLSGEKDRKATVFYFLCALAGLCAGLSKENSAMLPVMLVVIDVWFFESAWLEKAWDFSRKTGWKLRLLAAGIFLSSSYYAFFVELPRILSGYATRNFTLVQRLLTEARVVVWYMSLLLWPVPSRLSMEHDPRISTSLFSPFTTLAAILFIAALIYLAVRLRKRYPVITFGIVWFFLNLIIESTVVPLELVFEHRLYLPSMGFYLSVAAIFAIVLRSAAQRLPRAEFAKAACSLLLVCASVFSLLTFARNGVWKNGLTIRLDTVKKAPDSARANADLANFLCEVGRYDEAMRYAEKAIRLGKNGPENDCLAQNAIVIALLNEGETGEAIEREEKFFTVVTSKRINVDAYPSVCLNVAQACLREKRPEEAYAWALRALKYIRLTNNSRYKMGNVELILQRIFSRYDADEVDPALTASVVPFNLFGRSGRNLTKACGEPAATAGNMISKAPGVCPLSTRRHGAGDSATAAFLTAMVFQTHGEEQYAREILEEEYARNPGDPLVKAEIAKLQKEDAQNLAQKKNWNTFQKYVRSPFTPFHFDMTVAYLVQKDHLSKWYQRIGKNRLDAALNIHPDSREARLLEAWYLYQQGNDAKEAVKIAGKVLASDPGNANVWLALGFFRAKAGDAGGAVAAFKKVIQLYPGYPKRTIVEALCRQLQAKGKPIESASARK
ncbi:MAG: tetratricopeptide repeat protein [Syntrophobacteraceae bacterium]